MTDDLIGAIRASDAHPDLAEYVREARKRGGTPILESIEFFHRASDVSRLGETGTEIERTLYHDGAPATLDEHGHLDETNREIMRAIVENRYGFVSPRDAGQNNTTIEGP